MNNSKIIVDLLARAMDHGISVFLQEEVVKLKVAKDASLPPDLIPTLAQNKEEIRRFLLQEDEQPSMVLPDICVDRGALQKPPLSFSQQGLWIVDMLQGHSVQFNMPTLLSYKGVLDIAQIEYAFGQIVRRHEALRTVFTSEDGVPYQHVLPAGEWRMDYSEDPGLKERSALEAFVREEGGKPFDLSRDHMLRVRVVKTGVEEYVILLVFHHIAVDGWSMAILVSELIELYKAASENRLPHLPELPVQYTDYAVWQRSYYSGEVLNKELKYWEEKLAGVTPIDLPADYPRPARMSVRGGTVGIPLEKELTAKLRELAAKEGVTMFMILLAAFKVLLYKYSGQENICVGTPVANRLHKEVESLIGFFPNSLALRSDLQGNPSFRDLLAQVKKTLLEGFSRQGAPFEKVVDRVEKVRDMSRSPLFQVMFIYMNHPAPELRLEGGEFSVEHFPYEPARFDLTLYLDEMPEGMQLDMIYCRDIYTASRVRGLLEHYRTLLRSICQSPRERISRLSILDFAERNRVLLEFNHTAANFPEHTTFLHLFAMQAAAHPDRVAVICNGASMTYDTLHRQSNRLAHYLQAKGVSAESPVCVCMDRSISLLVTLLGIMKAGGTYLPVDPEYPPSRLEYILQDSGALWIISEGMPAAINLPAGCGQIHLPAENEKILRHPDEELSTLPGPDNLAYIIYTSGSTGRPKGAMIEHKGMLNHLFAKFTELSVDEHSKVLQNASQSFDISIWQLLVALPGGGTTFIYQQEIILDAALFLACISRDRLTHVEVVPSYLRVLLDHPLPPPLPHLKYLLVTGETLPKSLTTQWFDIYPDIPLVNAYGPTEASDDITHFIMTAPPVQDRVPVGHVLPNMQIYIFSPSMELCPVGVPGEIGVGGIGVGRGYLNNGSLTAEKFIDNPFDAHSPYKLYRTGDLGYWLPDGNIAFAGRKDDQVKIRGHRIELGEIEAAIDAVEGVASCCVVVKGSATVARYLVCYYIPDAVAPDSASDQGLIQQRLAGVLPDHMVPSRFVLLDKMPLTSNGKIDRKSLTLLEDELYSTAIFKEPSTWIEQTLAAVWRELIPMDKISVYDNFFQSGGDSILVIQFVSRARRQGIRMQPKDLFEHQTIAALAEIIQRQPEMQLAEQGILTGEAALLPAQRRLLDQAFPGISHYNRCLLLPINKNISISHLRRAVDELFGRHDALRFIYTQEGGTWRQYYGSHQTELEVITPDTTNIENICDQYQRSLHIEKGEVIRFVLIQTPDSETYHRLFIVAHQLVMDGSSLRILVRHLEEILDGLENGKEPGAVIKSVSCRGYAEWLQQRAVSKKFVDQDPYWRAIVEQSMPLPSDLTAHASTWKEIRKYVINLDKAATNDLLQKVNQVYGTTTKDILLSVLASTVALWTNRGKVLIGIEVQDREHIAEVVDTANTVGCFSTVYPVLLEAGSDLSLSNRIKSIKEQLRSVPDKGIGYELSGLAAYAPSFEVLFCYTELLPAEECIGPDSPFPAKWRIESRIKDDGLTVTWHYSEKEYKSATIAELAGYFLAQMTGIISSCAERKDREFTPSDYGLHGLVSKEEFEEFVNDTEDIDILKF